MNIKALLTTLMIGSSSMASADSLTVSGSVHVSLGSNVATHYRPAGYQQAPIYRPVVTQPVFYRPVVTQPVWHAPVYNPTNTNIRGTVSHYTGWIGSQRRYITASNAWYDLSEATRIDVGREAFEIGADKGVFRGIRLDALGNGRSNITQVVIWYADAQGAAKKQVVDLNTWIGRGNASLTIDLDGNYRQIERIVVYGATDHGSAYKLMAL